MARDVCTGHLALTLATAAVFLGCSGDLGLNDFQFACEKDSDCGEGGRCNPAVGCASMDAGRLDGGAVDAAIPFDGGLDGGPDAGRGDAGSDAGDTGHEDSGAGDANDAGPDDDGGGGDVGSADAGDAGTFVLTWSSLYQAGAGSCASVDYRLSSVTGWVALPSGFSQTNVLRPESPVKK